MDVVVKSDYDGYFESWVKGWIQQKVEMGKPFNHKRVVITSGPWRSYAVSFEKAGEELRLDFYSALRAGFGGVTASEIREIIELL